MGRGGHPAGEVSSGPRSMQISLGFFDGRGALGCGEFAGWLGCEKKTQLAQTSALVSGRSFVGSRL